MTPRSSDCNNGFVNSNSISNRDLIDTTHMIIPQPNLSSGMTKTTIGFTIFLPTHPATKNPHHRLLLIQSAPWAFAPKFQSLRDAWNLMISLIGSKPSNVYSISAKSPTI
ncbi:hypothetical protein HanHA300_Chr08g0289111 [Helianthus annuus]|nr:hypothetical protein HanHA300_Chr08g0289111 [Helianthus annuus]KAJ0554406.1 hypothetical protein HanHA89_Chr08g0307411 [Helianthus annuus]